MDQDKVELVQKVRFKLEKIDNATGKVVEVIEGGDELPTTVTVFKEQAHGVN